MRPIVSEMAEDMGVHYIDMYEFTENHPEYYDDGIHPNAYGNKMIAEYLYETIWK
jgi:lysophospholipase L1-like esterase